MVVGGTFVEYTAKIAFFLYPIFVFSCLALLYNLCSYAIVVYLEKFLFLRYVAFVFCSIVFLTILGIHLGAHTFLLSVL